MTRIAAPLIVTLVSLGILISLGTWQLQRLEWKNGILNAIERGIAKPPRPIDTVIAEADDPANAAFSHVAATGVFDHEGELYLFGSAPGQPPGYRVVTPLMREGAPPLLVIRGSVPEALRDPSARREGQIEGKVTVTGLLRSTEEKGMFGADNDIAGNLWFHRDVAAMAEASGHPGALPVMIEAANVNVPGGWPRGRDPQEVHDVIPNRHLEYAITWYAMAVVMVVIAALFIRGRLRTEG